MRKITRFLSLLALLMTAATGAWAQQTLTVYDGTTVGDPSPACILYCDEYTRSQTVIPSTALTAMKGCDITAMTFYSASAAIGTLDCSFDFYLKEVSYSAFANTPAFESQSSCTTVYQGKPTIEDGTHTLTITFSKPFHYNGGNLLIGAENPSKHSYYYDVRFYGTNTGSSLSNISIHHKTDLASASIASTAFIPKTTFTYEVPTYSVKMKDGTQDAKNWTIASGENSATGDAADGLTGLKEGDAVTLTYGGRLKVKSVTAVKAAAPSVPDGAINGKFSVSATKQVYFSKGNLRYASSKWSFFDNQYDYYTGYSADAWDKFGWSTSASTYGMSTSSNNTPYSGNFVDWGATMGTDWFTLTSAEWTYLFNTRSASTVGGTENGRYAKAKVNDVQGVILFPDTYTHPDGVTAPVGVNAKGETGWNGNSYTVADWTKMESAGCVFLPAAGDRGEAKVGNTGTRGYYWSATPDGTYNAYRMSFYSDYLSPASSTSRFGGYSVRLVQAVSDAAPAEEPVTLATPLTIEAVTPGTIKVQIGYGAGTLSTGMKYSVNGGTKTLITTTTSIEGLKAGDKVQFYGNGTQTQVYGGDDDTDVSFQGSGDGFQTKVYGNIMSLLDETGFATKTDLPDATFVFSGLLSGNTTLTDASELLLPATTLTVGCYYGMFEDCTSLTTAPKLPATTLATGCYRGMFMGCTSLTTAPKLPATTLAKSCYYTMFFNCTSLTSAYVKAAYTEENGECDYMFDLSKAAGAVLHTTPDNKASWETMMNKDWKNWTVADDWEE